MGGSDAGECTSYAARVEAGQPDAGDHGVHAYRVLCGVVGA